MGMILISLMLQGCVDQRTDLEKIDECVTEFVQITYQVNDHQAIDRLLRDDQHRLNEEGIAFLLNNYERRISPYVTEEAMKEFSSDRFYLRIMDCAAFQKFNISILSVSTDLEAIDGEEVFTAYDAILHLIFEDGYEVEVNRKGQLQLVRDDNNWKINHETSGDFWRLISIHHP